MKILCSLGMHAWKGCRCERCGKSRNTGHDWQGCKCSQCSEVRNSDHTWQGCQCSTCDRKRDEAHAWDGCTCTICRKTRNAEHKWEGCRCARCGARGKSGHTWRDLTCATCGQERFADDAISFQVMPLIKNVAIKVSAFETYKAEKGLNSFSGPAYLACRILGLSDDRAKAISSNSGAWQLETGPASHSKSTGHWGNTEVHKVAILVRYL